MEYETNEYERKVYNINIIIYFSDEEELWIAFCIENDEYYSEELSKYSALQDLIYQIKTDMENPDVHVSKINANTDLGSHLSLLEEIENFEKLKLTFEYVFKAER